MSQSLGLAVKDGILQYTSPSAIQRADHATDGGCMRKWWFRYVARIPEPQSKGAMVGQEMHSRLEHRLKTGENVLTDLERAGERFLPTWKVPLQNIERPMHEVGARLTCAGILTVGMIDWWNDSGIWITSTGQQTMMQGVELADWKSTSNFKYAKSATELLEAIQMIAYGRYAVLNGYHNAPIRLSHVYFLTRGRPEARKVTVAEKPDFFRAAWEDRVTPVVQSMKETARCDKPDQVPYNSESCGAFGGCAYRDQCPRSSDEILQQVFGSAKATQLKKKGEENMSLLGMLPKKANGQSATVNRYSQALNEIKRAGRGAPGLTGKAAAVIAEATKVDVPAGGGFAGSGDLAELTLQDPEQIFELLRELQALPAEDPGITPPDMPPPDKTHEPIPETAPQEVQEAAAPVEEKRRRGRPKKAKEDNPGTATADHHLVVQGTFVPAQEVIVAINAIPSKGAQDLAPLVYAQAKALAEKASVVDIRCAPDDSPLAFGKWKGVLLAQLAQTRPQAGNYYLLTGGDELLIVAAGAFRQAADLVVEGVR